MPKMPGTKRVQHARTLFQLWPHRRGLFSMLMDMLRRRYRASFFTTLVLILGTLYILSPIDLIPDWIPVIGWADDTFVLVLMVKRLLYELQRYNAQLPQAPGTLKLVSRPSAQR